MKRVLLAICCCGLIAQAGDIEKKEIVMESSLNNFNFEIGVSTFNAKSHETVYIPQGYASAGRKISELTWEAENIALLGINLNYNMDNGFGFYGIYKKNITTDGGVMDDLDWVDNANPDTLTHWSHHDNTDVDNVSILDLGVKYEHTFTEFDIETISSINAWVSLGYKKENQTYKAYDGYGNYLGTPVVFSGLGITYEQEYKGPYIGLGADFKNKNYILNISTKYSPLISAEYQDRHHMRVPPFTESTNFDDTSMINFNIGLGYAIYENQVIRLSYEYTEYDYVRGDRTRVFDDGTIYNWINSAAIDSKNSLVSLSYSYTF